MKRLLIAAALLALALTGAASGSHARPANSVSSSLLVQGGHIRITLTLHSPAQIGGALRGRYHVHNLSRQPRKIQLTENLWEVIHSPDGTKVNTRWLYGHMGPVGPARLRPGKTISLAFIAPRVRSGGPLRITPVWNGIEMPSIRVAVATPGRAPSASTAMTDVVASTGHLLDSCTPTSPSTAVVGTIVAPKHSAPPLQAACSIHLHREHGFVRAEVLVVSPPGLRGVHLRGPYRLLAWTSPQGRTNATAVGWLFVVTKNGAVSVDSTSVESTKRARGGAPSWQWTTSGFQPRSGGTTCGAWGGGGGGFIGPEIEFVSKCHIACPSGTKSEHPFAGAAPRDSARRRKANAPSLC